MSMNIIFDMDGVIFDTERLYYACYVSAGEQLGIEGIENVVDECFGMTLAETGRVLQEHCGKDIPLEEFYRLEEELFMRHCDEFGVPLKEGAAELLAYLKERRAAIALASSTETEIVRKQLRETGLADYFDVIIGGDMVGSSKPAPDIFLLTAEKLAADAKDCIIIEDSFNGVRAAYAAGATVFMVPDILQPTEEIRILADRIFATLTEVQEYLEKEKKGSPGALPGAWADF